MRTQASRSGAALVQVSRMGKKVVECVGRGEEGEEVEWGGVRRVS